MLAVDNRYREVWPDLEESVADNFRAQIEQDVERSAAKLAESPDDLELMTAHMSNLRLAGRSDEAIALGQEAAGDKGFWLVNEYADALKDSGHYDEAIAEYD